MIIPQAILIQVKQENNQEIVCTKVVNRLEIHPSEHTGYQSIAEYRRVFYVNEKLQRSVSSLKRLFAPALGVEESSLMIPNEECSKTAKISEEMKTKASDLDRLTKQMRENLALESTTSEEKMKILTLTPESWSIVKAASYFGVSEYLTRQARKLKKCRGRLGSSDKNCGKPLPASTAEKAQLFYEDDAHSRLMPGKKDFVSIKKCPQAKAIASMQNLHELYVLFKEQNPELKVGFSKFCSLRPKWCITVGTSGTHPVCICTIHQNAKLLLHATKTGHTYKELMEMIVCNSDNKTCMVHRCEKCPRQTLREYLETVLDEHEEVTFQQWQTTDCSKMIMQTLNVDEFIEFLVGAIDT